MEIPTQINVHVPAKGDKFLGDDIGGVQQVKINSHFDRLSDNRNYL